jgi:hypothetical protein
MTTAAAPSRLSPTALAASGDVAPELLPFLDDLARLLAAAWTREHHSAGGGNGSFPLGNGPCAPD